MSINNMGKKAKQKRVICTKFNFLDIDDKELIRGFYKDIESKKVKVVLSLPGQAKIESNFRERISEALKAVYDFGLSLNIDYTSRIPGDQDIFVFERQTYKLLEKKELVSKGSKGSYDVLLNLIYLKIPPTKKNINIEMLNNLSHELIHSVMHKVIFFKGADGDYSLKRVGYKTEKDGSFRKLNEAIAEITSLQIIRYFWPKYSGLSLVYEEVSCTVPSYSEVFVVDGLISELAKRKRIDYREILSYFQKDIMLGSKSGLELIEDVLGSKKIEIVRKMYVKTGSDYFKLAEELGLKEFYRKLETWKNGGDFTYLEEL